MSNTCAPASPPPPLARRAAPPVSRDSSSTPLARVIWRLSGLNLALVCGVMVLLFVVSERWWIGSAITFLPRLPWGLPAVVLGLAGWWCHRPSLWVNAVALGLVLGPIMELRVPGLLQAPGTVPPAPGRDTLRVVSCNVQAYRPHFAEVLSEVARYRPDVVMLQEAFGDHPLLDEFLPDWHRLHHNTYWIASRYPLRLLAECQSEVFERVAGIVVELQTPVGPVVVANIHQMTARRGLVEINKSTLLRGEAARLADEFRQWREIEAAEIRAVVDAHRGERPLIVAGDFNTPTSSHVFQQVWGDLQSAFDVAGCGYGYTAPCRPIRFWLTNVPWARIDHILCSSEFGIVRCQVGRGNGSDHRVVAAELRR
uniref:Endonuclease/exonuclease/phosphatase domain-containing protein n=1 Tax=Schlesneria paludicola TaxID=360056 RepID=A0A7C4LLZ5_9PLAN